MGWQNIMRKPAQTTKHNTLYRTEKRLLLIYLGLIRTKVFEPFKMKIVCNILSRYSKHNFIIINLHYGINNNPFKGDGLSVKQNK